MSASRKKQARKAAEEATISSRAQEEQAKEARRKRNTLIYSIIGVVVVILIAILLIWNSGVVQRNSKVAEVNGEKVTAAQVAYYYNSNSIMYYANLYSNYGMTTSYDPTQSPKEQTITATTVQEYGVPEEYVGKTFHEYFLDTALESLGREQYLRAAAKEAGYTLSADGKATVESEMKSLDEYCASYLSYYGVNLTRTTYLQMLYGKNMNESKYRTCVENAVLADEFYNDHFDMLANYSDGELEEYYLENKNSIDTVTYYLRSFDGSAEKTTDEEGNTVEPTEEQEAAALAAAKVAASAALSEVEENWSIVKDNEEYTENTSTLETIGSLYREWLSDESRQSGDATVIESTSGTTFHLVVFGERFRDDRNTVDLRHILVEAKNEDDPATEDVDESKNEPTDEVYAAAKAEAEALLAQWKSGAASEESFAALAEEHSADTGSNTNGGLYTNVTYGYMIDNFNDWIFDDARQSGDVSEPIQNTESSTKGWHLIYYIGQDEPIWKITARGVLWNEAVADQLDIVRTDKLDKIADK